MALASDITELARHLPEPIVVVDAGCRWGFAEHWNALASHSRLFGFDADKAEVERLVDTHRDRPHQHFVAAALGATPGQATLLVTHEPGSSSLFPPTLATTTHLAPYAGATVESSVVVEIVTLDSWAAVSGVDRVDAMKLDTQGSELDILRGATRILEGVRHIEIEVAFNAIGEGAPLFGDVDAFLREHGFALWRLRDLVHYGLADALDPPLVTEHFWYDSRPQAVEMPGGQLTWCNAHFVRRDMYEPSRGLGWSTHLRDALITRVNGLHDLAVLSARRLLNAPCPEALRDDVRRMLEAVPKGPPQSGITGGSRPPCVGSSGDRRE